MKSLKDIENLSLENLEELSLDENVKVPTGLQSRISLNLSKTQKRVYTRTFVAVAASIAVVVGIGFGFGGGRTDEPVDTSTDPYMAYAEVEKAFAKISEGIGKGRDMVRESERIIEIPAKIY